MKSHQKENRYMRASPNRKSALSRLNKPLALRNGEANNRTGYTDYISTHSLNVVLSYVFD
jgi:hypothetical protein